jgi:hypothetical protein
MYVYMKGEPFKMKIQKQDLNWYDGEDTVKVNIFKESTLVMEDEIPDDGTVASDRLQGPIQELSMENPGSDLPEPGVYKIVIDAPGDVLIKRITTNLHKIVWESAVFPANNAEAYPDTATSPITLYTNALALIGQTYHQQGVQIISVDDQKMDIKSPQDQYTLIPKNEIAEVRMQKGDVVLQGVLGYFAFSKDSFFQPTPYRILTIKKPEDVELVDYILTDYEPPRKEGEWSVATREFDLKDAYLQDGKLSWVIKAPGLKKNNSSILIKDIELTLIKDPWLTLPWQR